MYINRLFQIFLYTRYVDDIYNSVLEEVLDKVLVAYNNYHPSLQFTFEFPSDGVLPFLDLALRLENGFIKYSHYVKPTQSNRLIPFTTFAPLNYKLSSLKGECKRLYRNTQDKSTLPAEFSKLKAKYFWAGYPLHFLDKFCCSEWAASPSTKFRQKPYTVFLPFLGQISEKIISFCSSYQVHVVPTKIPTLKQLLLPKQNVRTRPSPKAYVYALPCSSCPKVYIGQTSRSELRLKEHLSDIKAKKTSSAPFMHFKETGHLPADNGFTPLVYSQFYFNRLNLETSIIFLLKEQVINLQIPTHYGIKAWLSYLRTDHPTALSNIEQYFRKKITDSLKPKPIRQFVLPTIPKRRCKQPPT